MYVGCWRATLRIRCGFNNQATQRTASMACNWATWSSVPTRTTHCKTWAETVTTPRCGGKTGDQPVAAGNGHSKNHVNKFAAVIRGRRRCGKQRATSLFDHGSGAQNPCKTRPAAISLPFRGSEAKASRNYYFSAEAVCATVESR